MTPALLLMLAAPKSDFDEARLAQIPVRMKQFVEQKKVSGSVVLVAQRGRTVLRDAQGWARVEGRVPMREDTIFQIMSMTKPIVALAAMTLVEDGRLRLDAPVSDYLPGFGELVNGVKAERTPTVRMLMTHTSGLAGIDPGGLDDDAKRKIDLAEYGRLLAKESLAYEPGTKIQYSGPGLNALGRVIEVASGQSLPDYMRARIFEPLKMSETTFFLPEAKEPRLAWVYYRENDRLVKLDEDPMRPGAKLANAAGGLYSTVDDLGRLTACLSKGGAPILSKSGLRTMTLVQSGSLLMDGSDALGYGLGFTVVRAAAGTNQLKRIGTFGHTGAYGTEMWIDPASGVSAVFLGQGFGNVDEARKTFSTMVNAAYTGP